MPTSPLPIQAAGDFSSPAPDLDKLSVKTLKERWIARPAMVFMPKNNPAWLAAARVSGSKPPKIEFTGNTTVKGREAAIEASILEDPHKRHNAVERIIMGFIGGTFQGDGVAARPTDLSQHGVLTKVTYELVDDDGDPPWGQKK